MLEGVKIKYQHGSKISQEAANKIQMNTTTINSMTVKTEKEAMMIYLITKVQGHNTHLLGATTAVSVKITGLLIKYMTRIRNQI